MIKHLVIPGGVKSVTLEEFGYLTGVDTRQHNKMKVQKRLLQKIPKNLAQSKEQVRLIVDFIFC